MTTFQVGASAMRGALRRALVAWCVALLCRSSCSGEEDASHAGADGSCRVAYCFSGHIRSFIQPRVHRSIQRDLVDALSPPPASARRSRHSYSLGADEPEAGCVRELFFYVTLDDEVPRVADALGVDHDDNSSDAGGSGAPGSVHIHPGAKRTTYSVSGSGSASDFDSPASQGGGDRGADDAPLFEPAPVSRAAFEAVVARLWRVAGGGGRDVGDADDAARGSARAGSSPRGGRPPRRDSRDSRDSRSVVEHLEIRYHQEGAGLIPHACPGALPPDAAFAQWYKMRACFRLVEQREERRSALLAAAAARSATGRNASSAAAAWRFDWVVRVRPDVGWLARAPASVRAFGAAAGQSPRVYVPQPAWWPMSDVFALVPRALASDYFGAVSSFYVCHDETSPAPVALEPPPPRTCENEHGTCERERATDPSSLDRDEGDAAGSAPRVADEGTSGGGVLARWFPRGVGAPEALLFKHLRARREPVAITPYDFPLTIVRASEGGHCEALHKLHRGLCSTLISFGQLAPHLPPVETGFTHGPQPQPGEHAGEDSNRSRAGADAAGDAEGEAGGWCDALLAGWWWRRCAERFGAAHSRAMRRPLVDDAAVLERACETDIARLLTGESRQLLPPPRSGTVEGVENADAEEVDAPLPPLEEAGVGGWTWGAVSDEGNNRFGDRVGIHS